MPCEALLCRIHVAAHSLRLQQPMVALRAFAPVSAKALRLKCAHRRQHTCAAAGQDSDAEFAVFRFTLGIPGFDDDQIPRVIGLFGAALLVINHLAAGAYTTPAQGRTEALGAVVSAVCIATPSMQARLKQMQPGRVKGGGSGGGAFMLAPDLPDAQRQELAWASFALLRNTNVSGLLIWRDGAVLSARGTLGSAGSAANPRQALASLCKAVDSALAASAELQQAALAGATPLYLPDQAAMQRAGADSWGFTPASVQSMLAISLAVDQSSAGDSSHSMLLMFSEQPRGLSQRQRSWAAALASKLGTACL